MFYSNSQCLAVPFLVPRSVSQCYSWYLVVSRSTSQCHSQYSQFHPSLFPTTLVSFYIPLKHYKTTGFLIFCGSLERDRSSRFKMFCKKLFLKFRKIHRENNSASLFFTKTAGLRPANLLKKRLWHRHFPVNFVFFLRMPFLQSACGGCF